MSSLLTYKHPISPENMEKISKTYKAYLFPLNLRYKLSEYLESKLL
jgi:hypothetical protein